MQPIASSRPRRITICGSVSAPPHSSLAPRTAPIPRQDRPARRPIATVSAPHPAISQPVHGPLQQLALELVARRVAPRCPVARDLQRVAVLQRATAVARGPPAPVPARRIPGSASRASASACRPERLPPRAPREDRASSAAWREVCPTAARPSPARDVRAREWRRRFACIPCRPAPNRSREGAQCTRTAAASPAAHSAAVGSDLKA